MSDLFSKAFLKVLNEEEVPGEQQEMSDAEAMASTLDRGTNPEDFDVHAGSREASIAAARSHSMMVDMLGSWIAKIHEFTEFLNSQETHSIQASLAKATDKSIFGAIKTSESKKISAISKELAGLNETLKGYSVNANDPKYKGA